MSAPTLSVAGPSIGDVGGHSVVLAYGSVAVEYEALQTRAALFDRSHRTRIRLLGAKAAEMVAGLVTNDVSSLAPGQGCYAAALTAKGKIVADVRVLVEDGSVFTDAPPRAGTAWAAMVKKYVNPRIALHADESATTRDLGVFGATARHVVSQVTGIPAPALDAMAPYAHVTVAWSGIKLLVMRSPDLGVDGFELLAPSEVFAALWQRVVQEGAVAAGLDAWEIARVEAGRPEWGVDMDDTTIPQEANFDELHAISYTKGCYVGQETIARIHFRGHVTKHLRGIHVAGLDAPPAGATLHDDAGLQVGDVRTAVRSPRLGGIALAMIRREVAHGAALTARWAEEGAMDGAVTERRVEVVALPFATP